MSIDPARDILAIDGPSIIVLGTAQDGGYPQVGCERSCCEIKRNGAMRRLVACLGIADSKTRQSWMIDCTPDFDEQFRVLNARFKMDLDAVLLTHAHVGHYMGLINFGREIMDTDRMPVFAMPRMSNFLKNNRPWSGLVERSKIQLHALADRQVVNLSDSVTVVPHLVPHRDEDSETIAFIIRGPQRSVLYLPDIDGWEYWDQSIEEVIAQVDRAYIDGTFLDDDELPNRNMLEVQHPTIKQTMKRLSALADNQCDKVYFTHLNHTNPAIHPQSDAQRQINEAGFHIAMEQDQFQL